MASEEFAGPIGYVVFAFPAGASVGGGLSELLGAVDAGAVEVLDLECVGPDSDGRPHRLPLSELAADIDLSVFDGVETELLDDDDLAAITAGLTSDQIAIAVVYEDRSLAAVAAAWSASGGTELVTGGVSINDLAAELERTQA